MGVEYAVIKSLYQRVAKPLLFLLDPESAHDFVSICGRWLGGFRPTRWITAKLLSYSHPLLSQIIHGIKFTNPVGLSAGFDKDANLVSILPSVGFGFMEVGTVTPRAYAGNSKPRLVRLKKSRGLVVNYGLKNLGMHRIAEKITSAYVDPNFVLGVSIGKTNSPDACTIEAGVAEYFECMQFFDQQGLADFYTINISCPNTFGGEPFTTPERLAALLEKLSTLKTSSPRFIKMPVDLAWEDFRALLDIVLEYNFEGVVIANLTKNRSSKQILEEISETQKGGISGLPVKELSNALISQTYQYCGDQLTIIGVGGIFSAEDAYEKIKLGASLVELITGMIYEGPQLIGEINRGLIELLERDGYKNISAAVGAAHRV